MAYIKTLFKKFFNNIKNIEDDSYIYFITIKDLELTLIRSYNVLLNTDYVSELDYLNNSLLDIPFQRQ